MKNKFNAGDRVVYKVVTKVRTVEDFDVAFLEGEIVEVKRRSFFFGYAIDSMPERYLYIPEGNIEHIDVFYSPLYQALL